MRLDTLLEISKYIFDKFSIRPRLNTCGYPYIFYDNKNVVKELKDNKIGIVQVSLNSASSEKYKEICHPSIDNAFEETINFIKKCKINGIKTRISFVNYDININECKKLAGELEVEYKIREYARID